MNRKLLVAVAALTIAAAPSGATLSPTLVPSTGCLWGAWTKPTYSAGQTWGQAITELEGKIGRKFDLLHNYHDWTQTFPTAEEISRIQAGQILLLNCKPPAAPSWARVASGQEDAQIDVIAGRLKAQAPHKILWAFHHEPENDIPNYGSVTDYAAAFRHIHDRFVADGVTNVVYVWNVMGFSNYWDMYQNGLYPGDAYVDWIAFDPYNWFTNHNAPWKTFQEIVQPFYDWLNAHGHSNKPYMLAEFGCPEDTASPMRKADWLRAVPGAIQANFPNLKAVVYFDSFDGAGEQNDWWVETTANALQGFKDAGLNDFVNPLAPASAPPSAPTSLTATAVSSSQIDLAWTDTSGVETGFKVERKTGAGGSWAQIATTGANATTFQNTGLTPSTLYYYRVRASNAAGNSGYSNEANAATSSAPQVLTSITVAPASATVSAGATQAFTATAKDASNAPMNPQPSFAWTVSGGGTISAAGVFSAGGVNGGPFTVTATSGGKSGTAGVMVTGGVSGSVPPPWQSQDVGSPGAPGAAGAAGGTFTLEGSGADIWGAADAFHYVWQPLSGDVEILARVLSLTNTNGWAKAGVMIRDGLGADAREASMVVTPSNGTSFQRRGGVGSTSTSTAGPASAAPVWVRLRRVGGVLTASTSPDGGAWTDVGAEALAMGNDVQIGLVVTSHAAGTLATATFDSVSAQPISAASSGGTGDGGGGGGGGCGLTGLEILLLPLLRRRRR